MTEQPKSYKTAGAFRAALEARLQTRAREQGTDLQRLRRQVAFDRFLARMFSRGPKAVYPWILKGGSRLSAIAWTLGRDLATSNPCKLDQRCLAGQAGFRKRSWVRRLVKHEPI